MMSSALRSRKASFAFVGSVVAVIAVLGGASALAQVPAETAASEAPSEGLSENLETLKVYPESPRNNPFRDRFPDVVLRTHEGRNVRFYEDLIKDKIVMINFMYATCKER